MFIPNKCSGINVILKDKSEKSVGISTVEQHVWICACARIAETGMPQWWTTTCLMTQTIRPWVILGVLAVIIFYMINITM